MTEKKLYTTDGKVCHYSMDEEINTKLGKILGGKFTKYRQSWDAANRFELETEFPFFLHLDMNQNCNLRCPHCIVGQPHFIGNYYEGENTNWQEYQRIIDEGRDYGCPSMSPQGNNEPLLNRELDQYIKYASDRGFIDIMMNTNALFLNEEKARKLLDCGLTRIRFSIDAITAETYNQVRPGGDYARVVANVENFLKLKKAGGYQLPVVGVSFCKMRANEHEWDAFYAFWKNKVDMVTSQTFVPPILEKDFSEYYASGQCAGNGAEHFRCPQPFQRVVIRNKDITPCCPMFSSKLKLGEIGKDSIFEAWNSPAMKQLRQIHKDGEYKKNKVCRECVALIFPTSKNGICQ